MLTQRSFWTYLKDSGQVITSNYKVKDADACYATELKLPNGVELEVEYLRENVDFKFI